MIIAARPSMGKTSFVLSLANNMGFRLNIKVMILTLEMTKQVLINKLASSHLNIDYQRIRSYQLSKDELNNIDKSQLTPSQNKVIEENIEIKHKFKNFNTFIFTIFF